MLRSRTFRDASRLVRAAHRGRQRTVLFSTTNRNFVSSEAIDDDVLGIGVSASSSDMVGNDSRQARFVPKQNIGNGLQPRASAPQSPATFIPFSRPATQVALKPRSSSTIPLEDTDMQYFPSEEDLFEKPAPTRPERQEKSKQSSPLLPGDIPPKQKRNTPDQYASLEEYFKDNNIKSRPVEGGTWNVDDPLGWTKEFGKRSKNYNKILRGIPPENYEGKTLESMIKKEPGMEGYYDVSDIEVPAGVAIVRTKEQARIVLERLNAAAPSVFHACDTEVMDIDLSEVGPVGQGYVTCVSIYSGPDFDYGLGQGPGATLWIDNLDEACGILNEFKQWFEDEKHLKVWHNYGFDRHVLFNEGINVQGFGGDTMHMARLQNTLRAKGGGGYSLEALSSDLLKRRKKPMKEIFGINKIKNDGTPGRLIDLPNVEEMQRNPQHRAKWIEYSCYDAQGTWLLREALHRLLLQAPWIGETTLWDYYWMHMREFGEVLTDMERRGVCVDSEYLGVVEKQAQADREEHVKEFRQWAWKQIGPDGLALNPASSVQLSTFLFGGAINPKTKEATEAEKVLKVPREDIPKEALEAYRLRDEKAANEADSIYKDPTKVLGLMTVAYLQRFCREQGLKASGTRNELLIRLKEHFCSEVSVEHSPKQINVRPDIDKMSAKDLKAECKKEGLAVGIVKSDWQEYLRRHGGDNIALNIDKMLVKELKEECDKLGGKVDLLETLKKRLNKHYDEKGSLPGGDKKGKILHESEMRAWIAAKGVKPIGETREDLERQFEEVSLVDKDIQDMTEDELRAALRSRGEFEADKTVEEMKKYLVKDILMTKQLATAKASSDGVDALSRVLEKAQKTGEGVLADFLRELEEKAAEEPKYIEVKITSLGLTPEKYTAGGAASSTSDVLRKLAGDPFADPPEYGSAYERLGEEGCKALYKLCSVNSIETMLANFITKLQLSADEDLKRVHCSLNLNTDTGRLSSRQPNLQNQPALEKDVYKIRQAFMASPGNNLIVADYGQLELRILASLTECKSMIEAFEAGGDFHSRTAVDMFDYVRKALDEGKCLLEWDYSNGAPPKPLLKDMFASERRKAKTLNFSIAYGKTAHGLSKDWDVSVKEAEEMLQAWYAARPEVRKWQEQTKWTAKQKGITRTLMGRYRHLPKIDGPGGRKLLGSVERQSINTPIQGGAADIAMMAMNKINSSPKLAALGWVLLLQVHDEVILEGPEETAEEAFEEVVQCMQEPWVFGLKKTSVPLTVDGSYTHKNWYDAK